MGHDTSKNPQKAVQDLEDAQGLEPNLPALHYWKGVAYRQQGDLDLAQHSFEQALSLNQRYIEAQLALAGMALRRGQPDAALKYAQQVLQENRNAPEAHLLAGGAYFNMQDFSKAEPEFQQVIRLRPSSSQGFMRLGYVYLTESRYDAAEKQFEQSLALDPTGLDAFSGLVAAYRSQGQSDKAIARIRQQIAQGETASLDDVLGRSYQELGQFQQAEASFRRALQLDPQNFDTYTFLGNLYVEERTLEKAVSEFQEAVRIEPKSVGAWTVLGMLHKTMSQFKLAEKDYETALALDRDAAVAANNLAWLYCEQAGDMDKALELARHAKELLPNVSTVSDTLAWIYFKRQLFESAIPLLQEAVREQPKDPQFRFHLAASLPGAGKEAQARQELDEALRLDPGLRNNGDYKRIFGHRPGAA